MTSTPQLKLPDEIRERVFEVLAENRQPQWIETDPSLRVRRTLGAALLPEPRPGALLPDLLPCLIGAEDIAPISFPVINLDATHVVDVHLYSSDEGFEVLLIDASAQHAERQETQQQSNEIALLNRRLKKMTGALEQARHQAEAASNAKSRFIAGMSHEFRTPLTSVLGFTELMQQGVADPGQGLAGIRESAVYLLSLVDNLLEHGADNHGDVTVTPERIVLGTFFESLERQMQPLADSKSLALTLLGPADTDIEVMLDPIRCRQILINLLTNAVRHSDSGKVALEWQVDNQRLTVQVVDQGCGISGNDLERIFRPFERGEQAQGRPGAGLGLSISRQLARAMGGELSVRSEVGQGSTFELSVPLAEIIGRAPQPNDNQPRASILVVDDDPNICAVLTLALADAGHPVSTCSSLSEVQKELADHGLPDIALVDLDLYGQDGLTVVAELKAAAPELPVLGMSADSSDSVSRRVIAAGCQGFVAKPFELTSLADLLQQSAGTVADG